MQINTISDIQALAQQASVDWKSFGNVSVKEKDDLLLFNYTAKAQYEGRWNFFERVSRGLIINRMTGQIVARPFDKFFNWGEGDRYTSAKIKTVTEKMDGSLGILYRHNDNYHIATRGSFNSDQAIWATEFLNLKYNLSDLPRHLTLLFEIIYPDNRIVVDYQGQKDLILLGARWTNGIYSSFNNIKLLSSMYGFSLPTVYEFDNIYDILHKKDELDVNHEGWVVEFRNEKRFKFKGKRYRELHKAIAGLSFKNTLKAMQFGQIEGTRDLVPDEFLDEFNYWVNLINLKVLEVKSEVEREFENAPKRTRKDFALWASGKDDLIKMCLFARLDEKPLDQIIYKHAFN